MSIDPLRRKCICGNTWYFHKLHYMKMILFGGLTVTCNQCGRKHHFRLIYHCIEEYDDTRVENTELETAKQELWRNA